HVVERAGPLEIAPFWNRHANVAGPNASEIVLDPNESFGMWIGKWMEERRVDDAEDCRRRPDTERDRQDGDDCEHERAQERAQSESHVLLELLEPCAHAAPLIA